MTRLSVKKKVREILTSFLEVNQLRKTPERYAILDAIYDMEGHFTLEELGGILEKSNFRVSRATLYNTMKLFIEMRLVIRHRFIGRTMYEACYRNENHIHQVCTVCGKVKEEAFPDISDAINNARLKRFRRDGFTLYIYGICSTCQARITRKKNRMKKSETK